MLICAIDLVCRNQCETARDCLRGQQCVSHTCADPDELEGGQLPQLNDGGVELRGEMASSSDASTAPTDGAGDSTTDSGGGTADAGPDVSSGAGGSSGGSTDSNLPEAPFDSGSDATTSPKRRRARSHRLAPLPRC